MLLGSDEKNELMYERSLGIFQASLVKVIFGHTSNELYCRAELCKNGAQVVIRAPINFGKDVEIWRLFTDLYRQLVYHLI